MVRRNTSRHIQEITVYANLLETYQDTSLCFSPFNRTISAAIALSASSTSILFSDSSTSSFRSFDNDFPCPATAFSTSFPFLRTVSAAVDWIVCSSAIRQTFFSSKYCERWSYCSERHFVITETLTVSASRISVTNSLRASRARSFVTRPLTYSSTTVMNCFANSGLKINLIWNRCYGRIPNKMIDNRSVNILTHLGNLFRTRITNHWTHIRNLMLGNELQWYQNQQQILQKLYS